MLIMYFQNINKVVCCGRQFGTKSLKIHYPQCLDKFRKDEVQRHVNAKDRRQPPQFTQQQLDLVNNKTQWTDEQTNEFYKLTMQKYRAVAMVQCQNCQRKFTVQAAKKHTKNCILINGNLNPVANLKKVQSQKVLHFYQKNIKKPKSLMCYICGRQFGLTSLHIHQKSCYQKYKIQQSNKIKSQRKKIPELPEEIMLGDYNIVEASEWSQQKITKYNQAISNTYNKKSLAECYICQRTFFEDSLAKHMVHCQNNLQKLKLKRKRSLAESQTLKRCQSIQKSKKQRAQQLSSKQVAKPKVLMCHICGRQYGLSSLIIHLKKCPQKFRNQQQLKAPQDRKKVPQLPEQLDTPQYDLSKAIEWDNQKIEAYNRIVHEIYNNQSLQTCYICNRTFFQESLPKHMKYCEKYVLDKIRKSKSRTARDNQIIEKHKSIQKQKHIKSLKHLKHLDSIKPKTLICYVCGRQFGLTSLSIHVPKCIDKFTIMENKKPLKQRKQLPVLQNQIDTAQFDILKAQNWSKEKIEEYNKKCGEIYKKKTLSTCQFCQRSFFDEQISKHIKYCQKQTLRNLSKSKNLNDNEKILLKRCKSAQQAQFLNLCPQLNSKIRQPRMLTCHVCGRQFGISSLKIHLSKCQQKFIKYEQKRQENVRKVLPCLQFNEDFNSDKYNINYAQTWSTQMIKLYNQKALYTYRKDALSTCHYCNRSFFSEQLPKHLKFCQKESFKKIKKSGQLQTCSMKKIIEVEQMTISSQIQQIKNEYPILNKSASTSIYNASCMSVIVQQPQQHIVQSLSPSPCQIKNQTSPSRANNLMKGVHKNSQEKSILKITPLQISSFDFDENQKQDHSFCQNSKQSGISEKQQQKQELELKQNFSILNKYNEYDLKVKQTKNLIENQYVDSNSSQILPKKINCQHCNKSIKVQLRERHMQMCRSNTSMTGYMTKSVKLVSK